MYYNSTYTFTVLWYERIKTYNAYRRLAIPYLRYTIVFYSGNMGMSELPDMHAWEIRLWYLYGCGP